METKHASAILLIYSILTGKILIYQKYLELRYLKISDKVFDEIINLSSISCHSHGIFVCDGGRAVIDNFTGQQQ